MSDNGETATTEWQLDLGDAAFQGQLHEVLGELRSRCPVLPSSSHGGFTALLSHADVVQVARDYKTFTSTDGITIPRVAGLFPVLPAEADPPEHTEYRRLVQRMFNATAMGVYEGEIREVATHCLDAVVSDGKADLVADLAVSVPPHLIASIMGFPDADREKFVYWIDKQFEAAYSADYDTLMTVIAEFYTYLAAQLTDRKGNPDGSVLSAIANGRIGDRGLTEEEMLGMSHLILVGGYETTISSIGSMLLHIASLPGLKAQLLDDLSLIPAMVEECLRFESPVMGLGRTVTTPTVLGGAPLEPGDRVLLVYPAANRDPDVFADPDAFVCPREHNPHVAFGAGHHRCLGEHLARLEMRVVAEEVLRRIPDYELESGYEPEWAEGRTTRTLRRLPVVFTPGASPR